MVPEAPYDLVERMRASIVVLGPLLARFGEARVSVPGGDDFGHRPIDMHLRALEQLGATFTTSHGYIEGRAERLVGARVILEYPSVGATENLLMAAVRAKGTTVIDNAAREPEIADLAAFLNAMGAEVHGAGGSTITVEGVERLHPVTHTVVPDRIEAATYLAAVGMAGGAIQLHGARADHMEMLLEKLGDMGLRVDDGGDVLWATAPDRLRSVDVSTLPYPGVATDYKPLLVALLSVADGVGLLTENVFAGPPCGTRLPGPGRQPGSPRSRHFLREAVRRRRPVVGPSGGPCGRPSRAVRRPRPVDRPPGRSRPSHPGGREAGCLGGGGGAPSEPTAVDHRGQSDGWGWRLWPVLRE